MSLDEVDEKAAAAIRENKDAIEASPLLEDREALAEIEKDIKESGLSAGIKAHLSKLGADAAKALPEKSDAEAEVSRKLAGSSRSIGSFFKKVAGVSKYSVTVYNESGLTFNCTFEGTRYGMNGRSGPITHTGEEKGKAELKFWPASGPAVTYAVDSGKAYVFNRRLLDWV
ncbi:MAG: hypothetical protein K2W96_22705 [Gemmataceae bacterium]|nr:hypothetical protein [Gemmataceae bacterium]